MKISTFPLSLFLLASIVAADSTLEQERQQPVNNAGEDTDDSPRLGGQSNLRRLIDVQDVTVLEDSAEELDMTSVICRVVQYDVQFADRAEDGTEIAEKDDNDEGTFCSCFTNDSLMGSRNPGAQVVASRSGDQVYNIDVEPEMLDQLELDNDNKSYISISKAIVNRDKATIDIMDDAAVALVDPPTFTSTRRLGRAPRQLSPSTGDSPVLILRVTYRGTQPDLTARQLQGIMFGTGPKAVDVSLRSQMEACSFGQLRYQPAQGDGIQGGVAEIFINQSVGGDVQVLENLVLNKFNNMFDDELKDSLTNVMMVMPDDNLRIQGRNWLAYGYLGQYITVFNNYWAASLTATVHEIGHNLNLHHSGKGDLSYGDTSGFMGYGVADVGEPASCFNAQKHFNLGWFEARGGVRRLETNELPWHGYLAFFGDYNVTAWNEPVVINIGTSEPRLFLQYNRAKGINHETRMFADSVSIVKDDGSPEKSSGRPSWFAGELAAVGDTWNYNKFHGNSKLSIRICEIISGPPDRVRLSIILKDGVQQHSCKRDLPPICDDDLQATFTALNGKEKTCAWLAKNINVGNIRANNCVQGQGAYDTCPETCGKCTDDCEDTPGVNFKVGFGHGRKDCLWLSTRQSLIDLVCRHGHAAYDLCHETCNRCDFP